MICHDNLTMMQKGVLTAEIVILGILIIAIEVIVLPFNFTRNGLRTLKSDTSVIVNRIRLVVKNAA